MAGGDDIEKPLPPNPPVRYDGDGELRRHPHVATLTGAAANLDHRLALLARQDSFVLPAQIAVELRCQRRALTAGLLEPGRELADLGVGTLFLGRPAGLQGLVRGRQLFFLCALRLRIDRARNEAHDADARAVGTALITA